MLVGPSKCLKQIISIKYNRVLKNPNWPEDFREQIQLAVREGLELEASELQVQRSIKMKAPLVRALLAWVQKITKL